MEIIRTPELMQAALIKLRSKRIAFVPTMGYLHTGHLTLMAQARKDNDIVVASIFVNPLQFGPNEDYDAYPRDTEKDTELAQQAGVDFLFIPSVEAMYPKKAAITLTIGERTDVLCGRSRPGHFDGVVTVLTKLFNIVRPDRAYFGMKDAQQLAVIEALVTDLNFGIEIIGIPTVREADGLAKSSRNVFLEEAERVQAVWLSKALKHAQKLLIDGERNTAIIEKEIKKIINTHTDGIIDYAEILAYPTMQSVSLINDIVLIAIAVQFKHARLIDNIVLDKCGNTVNVFN